MKRAFALGRDWLAFASWRKRALALAGTLLAFSVIGTFAYGFGRAPLPGATTAAGDQEALARGPYGPGRPLGGGVAGVSEDRGRPQELARRSRRLLAQVDGGRRSPEISSGRKRPTKDRDANAPTERRSRRRRETAPSRDLHGTIAIGIDYQRADAANSFFRQYGVDAAAADTGTQARAVADWINAHGGIAGRRVELRLRSFDFYRERLSVVDRITCASFAEAPKTIAAIDTHASTDILIPCLADKGIPTLVDTQSTPTLADFAQRPTYLYSLGSPAIDRPQRAYVRGLREAGFFERGKRVGLLLTRALPQYNSAADALRRALSAEGVDVTETATVSTEDVASFFATEASALLKMRAAGVTRIVTLDDNGVVTGQFMRLAQTHGYKPIYGLNSISSPQFVADNVPAAQLRGAVGIGWSPLVDVRAADDPHSSAVRARCDSIFAAADVPLGGRTPFGQYAAHHVCDSLLAVQSALKAGESSTPGALRAGLERIGSSRASPLTLGARLDSSRHDASTTWRLLRFDSGCGCFRYRGPARGF